MAVNKFESGPPDINLLLEGMGGDWRGGPSESRIWVVSSTEVLSYCVPTLLPYCCKAVYLSRSTQYRSSYRYCAKSNGPMEGNPRCHRRKKWTSPDPFGVRCQQLLGDLEITLFLRVIKKGVRWWGGCSDISMSP